MALDLDYSSYQDIREEAGQHHLVKTEIPSGVVDGTNTVFFVGRTYIVDRNYNDVIDVGIANGDVVVYVNEIAVEVFADGIRTRFPPFSTNDFKVVCKACGISSNSFRTIVFCFSSEL